MTTEPNEPRVYDPNTEFDAWLHFVGIELPTLSAEARAEAATDILLSRITDSATHDTEDNQP